MERATAEFLCAILPGMDTDAAELSSVTTVIEELARRVVEVANRRSDDPDDPVVPRLHEVERSLVAAERRLRTIVRDLR